VSSILRALKKLEERPADATAGPPWREKFASEHARHSAAPRAPWRSKPVIAAGAVALLAVGWLATHRPAHEAETAPEVTRNERPVAATPDPSRRATGTRVPVAAGVPPTSPTRNPDAAPGAAPNAFVERMRLAQQERREALKARRSTIPGVTPPAGLATAVPAPEPPGQVAREPARAPVSAPAPDDAPEPPTADADPQANGAASAPPTRTAAAPPTPPVTVPPRAVAAPAPRSPSAVPVQGPPRTVPSPPQQGPTERPEPVLTRLRDDAVKLQAVAWSSDPERRMAVINEQIVREGTTIEGYTIATIREESVVVRKGAESWELRYGH